MYYKVCLIILLQIQNFILFINLSHFNQIKLYNAKYIFRTALRKYIYIVHNSIT